MSFHSTLTPFLGEDATEYAPEHETTTGFMNAKFQEVLDNTVANKEAIENIDLRQSATENDLNVLNVTRGYLNTRRIFPCDTATLNGLIDNGKYSVSTSEIIDGIPAGWYNVDVTHHGASGHCTQILKRMGNGDAKLNGEVYIRTLVSETTISGGFRWDTKKLFPSDKITSHLLTRIVHTTTETVYTMPVDVEYGNTYTIRTGQSPSTAHSNIKISTNLGDFILKVATTNVASSMKNAGFNDFNAGVQVAVYFTESSNVKCCVISSVPYSAYQTKTEITSSNFKNGWQNGIISNHIDITGDLVTVNIELGVGTTTTGTTVVEGLPIPSKVLDVVGDVFGSSSSNIISNVGRVVFGLNTDGKLFIRSVCEGQYVLLNFSYRKG